MFLQYQRNNIIIDTVALSEISWIVEIEGCQLYKHLAQKKARQKKNPVIKKYAMANGGLSFTDAPAEIVL